MNYICRFIGEKKKGKLRGQKREEKWKMSRSKPDEYDKMKSGKSSQKVLFMKRRKRKKM